MTNPKYRSYLDRLKGRQEEITTGLDKNKALLTQVTKDIEYTQEAQVLIQTAAQMTQEELKYHVSELVTLALASVFEEPYEFVVDFVQRRNQTECDLFFKSGENLIEPLEASGGGAVEVASFALRMSLWTLQSKRTRPIFILDEPLKWLQGRDYPEKGMKMIKDISDKLGVQIIMVTHMVDQINESDRVHEVTMDNKQRKSRVVSYDN